MDKEIDMQAFCHDEASFISNPFVQNKRKAATDGRLIVIIPCDESDTTAEGRPFPVIDKIFTEYDWDAINRPFPIAMICTDGSEDCQKCWGDGKESEVCPTCDGDGECCGCSCGKVHECGDCNGDEHIHTGKDCPECGGNGVGYAKCQIGGWNFRGSYIKKINQLLPNPKIIKVGVEKIKRVYPCIKFEFNGGYGFLMGLSKDK